MRADAPVTDRARAGGASPGARAAVGVGIGILFIALLVAIDALAPSLFASPLSTRAQDGLTLAISVLIESLPFVVLGVVLSIVVQVWIPPGVLERWMPRTPWLRRGVLSLLGMFIPVCECGNVPFARGLLMRVQLLQCFCQCANALKLLPHCSIPLTMAYAQAVDAFSVAPRL